MLEIPSMGSGTVPARCQCIVSDVKTGECYCSKVKTRKHAQTPSSENNQIKGNSTRVAGNSRSLSREAVSTHVSKVGH